MTEEELALQIPMKGITNPGDTDVICGRGGAALRHSGNQTYRRLVNLNKGLYITCLKTEKLKISRSIVAAIREQRGRFLEKEQNSGAWYDIGDKKAIEKTSQALREGQPKLRQKMVEMSGAVAMDSQFCQAGLYPEHVNVPSAGVDPNVIMPPTGVAQSQQQQISGQQHDSQYQSQQFDIALAAAQNTTMRQDEIRAMNPPMPDPLLQDLHAEMFQRLSLRTLQKAQAEEQQHLLQQQQQQQNQQFIAADNEAQFRQRPSLKSNFSGGVGSDAYSIGSSQMSLLSDLANGKLLEGHTDSMLSIDSNFVRHLNTSSFNQQLNHFASTPGSTFSIDQFSMDSGRNGFDTVGDENDYVLNNNNTFFGNNNNSLSNNQSNDNNNRGHNSVLNQHPGAAYFFTSQQQQPSHYRHAPASYSPMTIPNTTTSSAVDPPAAPLITPSKTTTSSIASNHSKESSSSSTKTQHISNNNLQDNDKSTSNQNSNSNTWAHERDTPSNNTFSNTSTHMSSNSNHNTIDRRHVFAKMKYSRVTDRGSSALGSGIGLPKSSNHTASHRSLCDGMPDIHMVESQLSLYSNVSNMTDARTIDGKGAYPGVEVARVIDHSRDIQWTGPLGLGGNSRHSIMSGLSRIDDASIDQSIFSDLSRKIGNVSTRSVAMSEISAIDMQERDNEDDSSSSGFEHDTDATATQHLEMQKHAMEFDL